MSSKSDRQKKLIAILQGADSWVSAASLSKFLGTTERTVRNYVRELEGTYGILSSQLGYRLQGGSVAADTAATTDATSQTRARDVVIELLSGTQPLSIFDIADELGVSESTVFNKVMPAMRSILGRFDIRLVESDYRLSLHGSEQDKRRVLGFIARNDANGYFSSDTTLQAMFPGFDSEKIMAHLVTICQESGLLLNNYALNNLLIHLFVILVRLQSHNELEETGELTDLPHLLRNFSQKDAITKCADSIATMFETEYGVAIPARDYQQIVLLITLSIDRYDYNSLSLEGIEHVASEPFLEHVTAAANSTCDRYGIPRFNESFLLQLTLHVYNAYQRAIYHVNVANPIGAQIKKSYAPVYDMAVYFSHRIESYLNITFSEDEIAFIAFHMGAYIERNQDEDDHISCSIVVEQYHDFGQQFVKTIERMFGRSIVVNGASSVRAFLKYPTDCELLITTVDIPIAHPHKVLVSPLLAARDERMIRNEIEDIQTERTAKKAKEFLMELTRPSLYLRNMKFDSPEACIKALGELAIEEDLADQAFIDDALLREKVSSTSFVDGLAMPHSISQNAKHSFIAILQNDSPIHWGKSSVNLVMLIGLAQQDMKQFRPVCDTIVERFSSTKTVSEILKTHSLDELLEALTVV